MFLWENKQGTEQKAQWSLYRDKSWPWWDTDHGISDDRYEKNRESTAQADIKVFETMQFCKAAK